MPGYRCPHRATEIQHRLARARARLGDEHLLDAWAAAGGDVDHLADLCGDCHRAAHAHPHRAEAAHLSGPFGSLTVLRAGIIVRGEIRTGPDGSLHYLGPSDEFAARWPAP